MRFCLLLLLLMSLSCCTLPNDPNGTLQRVRGGELRAGLVAGQTDAGAQRAKLQRFAATLDASLVVRSGSTHELMQQLERGELELVATLPKNTPFKHAALSKPASALPRGDKPAQVWALPAGENAWLLEANTFLVQQGSDS